MIAYQLLRCSVNTWLINIKCGTQFAHCKLSYLLRYLTRNRILFLLAWNKKCCWLAQRLICCLKVIALVLEPRFDTVRCGRALNVAFDDFHWLRPQVPQFHKRNFWPVLWIVLAQIYWYLFESLDIDLGFTAFIPLYFVSREVSDEL